MIAGVGVDIVNPERFANAPEKLIASFLGWNEIQEFEKRNRCRKYLATRFAAKEAFIKASGVQFPALDMIEVTNDQHGKPHFAFNGALYNFMNKNHYHALLSISDEENMAVAFVTIEKRKR